MRTDQYQTGDRIYYKGDMANCEDFGIIIAIRPADKWACLSYDIRLDDGRDIKGLPHIHFEPSPGRRFWLLSEWEADRKVRIEAMQARIKELSKS